MSTVGTKRVGLLVRPTLETKFHIDYDWWERADRDLEIYLRSHLCSEHQETYADLDADVMVDYVDPETAEVTRVAGIQHTLISHCARQPNYLTPQTSLVNAVFRIFLANSNTPLTPIELAERLDRSPQMILRTFSGPRVYKGIRPYTVSESSPSRN
ncbi:MAG TPA: hypothetical protein G4O11_02560 [Anaerolineae bacterium]|nr:MAG: hypothetical protein AMJ88_16075 [Anaerolineae bacterium SM23_ 63]HEY42843.1 hypothetical protein [Anaerolineae bacterium]